MSVLAVASLRLGPLSGVFRQSLPSSRVSCGVSSTAHATLRDAGFLTYARLDSVSRQASLPSRTSKQTGKDPKGAPSLFVRLLPVAAGVLLISYVIKTEQDLQGLSEKMVSLNLRIASETERRREEIEKLRNSIRHPTDPKSMSKIQELEKETVRLQAENDRLRNKIDEISKFN